MYFCSGQPMHFCSGVDTLIRLMREFRALGARYEAWRRFTHLELASTMAIGDNFNDMTMLTVAGFSAAVANAPDEVKRVAHMVCTLPAGQGVVEAMKMVLDARRCRSIYA